MLAPSTHPDDPHYVGRGGWLRAAVLGGNDGILSVASLIAGVASATPDRTAILIAGAAGLVGGALSMAAGEYVSVSSQADMEKADIARERRALRSDPQGEMRELAEIYEERGLSPTTAQRVAEELSAHDALDAHVRDELGLSEIHAAQPLQAALASGTVFSAGAALPLLAAMAAPQGLVVPLVLAVAMLALGGLGFLGARAGGAPARPAVLRVVFWGLATMAATSALGHVLGVAI